MEAAEASGSHGGEFRDTGNQKSSLIKYLTLPGDATIFDNPHSSSSTQFSLVLSPFASFSPFASSCEDTAEEILAQIGSGKVCVTGGNWELVSDAAKVKMKKKMKKNL